MNWSLLASLVGSGAVVGGIGYLLKLATERAHETTKMGST
jgi:hypothetical protein